MKTLLNMYPKYSKKDFDNIVNGDAIWVYYFEPKRVFPPNFGHLKCEMPKYCQTNKNGEKGFVDIFFFTHKGHIIQMPVPKGSTITGKFYKMLF